MVKVTVLTGLTGVSGQLRPDASGRDFHALDPYWNWPNTHVRGVWSNQEACPVISVCGRVLVAMVEFKKGDVAHCGWLPGATGCTRPVSGVSPVDESSQLRGE
jgi:hypothetical protein